MKNEYVNTCVENNRILLNEGYDEKKSPIFNDI